MTPRKDDDTGVGVYVHIPFCERVCPYCDFAVIAAPHLRPADEAEYIDWLVDELRLRERDFEGRTLRTVYFGGGTPSMLRPQSIETLLAAIDRSFAGTPEEVTLEANPSDVDDTKLRALRALGVDRLSLGAQSFSDATLRRLGRVHDANAIRDAWRVAEDADFSRLSLDLIFATPGQDLAMLERDLLEVERLGARHVSVYELTIESGTPYALAASRGQLERPDEDVLLAMTERIEGALGDRGLARYEISNFAAPGHEARHNRRYWRREPVLGLGVGAWSLDPPSPEAPHGRRVGNPKVIGGYRERVEHGGIDFARKTPPLLDAQARGEAVFLALRTREGLDPVAFAQEFGDPPRVFFADAIDTFVATGLLRETERALALSDRGRLLADTVFQAFV